MTYIQGCLMERHMHLVTDMVAAKKRVLGSGRATVEGWRFRGPQHLDFGPQIAE